MVRSCSELCGNRVAKTAFWCGKMPELELQLPNLQPLFHFSYLDPQSNAVNGLKPLGISPAAVDSTMSSPFAAPHFFRQPIRYLRWASHEKPAIFYSCCISMVGPLSFVVVPPIRRFFGDGPREKIPMTYPSRFPRIDVNAGS